MCAHYFPHAGARLRGLHLNAHYAVSETESLVRARTAELSSDVNAFQLAAARHSSGAARNK